ncbi:uncharacterized protein LOC135614413 isoform X1 [Musa acuminata AAA Group]|uniref:uncharacterized protein LOC135614413 isoform X1 n=1 Tax=Musa acuminata AAA Group TaxID=214697 RepID=UPI0031CFCE18
MAAAIGGGVIQMLVSRHPPWRIPSRPSALPFEVEEAVAEEVEGALRPLKSLRRSALLLFALPALVPAPSAATALSIGIPGPKEWLKEQKKKSAKFVLAPIEASRNTLRSAVDLLNAPDSQSTAVNSEEMRRLLNLASRDCVPLQRSSLVQLQSQTGVEVCTFRLIVKNAASLLDKNNPVKLEAEVALDDLIRSFSLLGDVIIDGNFQVEADREKVKDGLVKTISSLDKFEQGIKECLGV